MLAQRASGILLHPTSLPGPHGSGDLGAQAYAFIDWLQHCGQSIWQWLPVSPPGPGNSPYQSVSAFAASPLLVALPPLVERGWLAPQTLADAPPGDHQVQFERVCPWRMQRLRQAHGGFLARAHAADHQAFEAWCSQQAGWLEDFSLFMALEAAHHGQPWWQWERALARRHKAALQAARQRERAEIDFWCFVQWCFDEQLQALRRYAADRGVLLMGDVPIYVAHHSADCWSRPDLFRLDEDFAPTEVAGAPPDALAPQGQRWGNPLYRWDRMALEGHAWWAARLRRALQWADLFRIDHFRGFAAGWEIPAACTDAVQGRWRPGPGRALFDDVERALGALRIVAEDLGHITPDVHALRQALGFAGMKVLQYAFGDDARHEYLPHNFERDCVAYTGTHDTDTVQGWWAQASPAERHFAGTYLACGAEDVHWAAIRATLNSVAERVIVPLQDVLGLDSTHRMNTPGTMGPHNWSWRFTWEMVAPEATRVLALMTAASGRTGFELLRRSAH